MTWSSASLFSVSRKLFRFGCRIVVGKNPRNPRIQESKEYHQVPFLDSWILGFLLQGPGYRKAFSSSRASARAFRNPWSSPEIESSRASSVASSRGSLGTEWTRTEPSMDEVAVMHVD